MAWQVGTSKAYRGFHIGGKANLRNISATLPETTVAHATPGLLARWHNTPLYLRILGALILGLICGALLGPATANWAIPSKLVLRLLGALAPALILVAIIHALMTADVRGTTTVRMFGLLILNTLMAIFIGLLVANVIQPGRGSQVTPPSPESKSDAPKDILAQFLDNVPKSLLGPLTDDGKVLGVIFIAVAFGLALRKEKNTEVRTVQDLVELMMRAFITVLHWIIDVIPFAIFGIVASIVGTKGFSDFQSLGKFVLAVILALILQAIYYLVRIRFGQLGATFRVAARHTRCLSHGVFHGQFHGDHARHLFKIERSRRLARTIGRHGFFSRRQFQQRWHGALRSHVGAIYRADARYGFIAAAAILSGSHFGDRQRRRGGHSRSRFGHDDISFHGGRPANRPDSAALNRGLVSRPLPHDN